MRSLATATKIKDNCVHLEKEKKKREIENFLVLVKKSKVDGFKDLSG